MSRLLTLAEVAERLGLSDTPRAVYDIIRSGRLKAVRQGQRKTLVQEDDLNAYVESCRVPAPPRKETPRREPVGGLLPKIPNAKLDKLLKGFASNKTPLAYCGPAVYFLFHGDELVYIGQATNLLARIGTHFGRKEFTHFSYIECAVEDLNLLERYAINKFKPRLNRR